MLFLEHRIKFNSGFSMLCINVNIWHWWLFFIAYNIIIIFLGLTNKNSRVSIIYHLTLHKKHNIKLYLKSNDSNHLSVVKWNNYFDILIKLESNSGVYFFMYWKWFLVKFIRIYLEFIMIVIVIVSLNMI